MLRQAALCFLDSAATDARRLTSAVHHISAVLGKDIDEETDRWRWECVTAQCGAGFIEDKVRTCTLQSHLCAAAASNLSTCAARPNPPHD